MARASHISGGELFYEYLGPGLTPNTDEFRITVRLFRECNSTGQQLNSEVVDIGIFSTATGILDTTIFLNKLWAGDPPIIQNTPGAIPCLVGDGSLCYQIGLFNNIIDLPRIPGGYTLTWVRCCRQQITNIFNTPFPDSSQGSTFVTHIPGTNLLHNGVNNSPQFVVKDTVLVCAGKPFKLDFSAFDIDNDSLSYTFCDAYIGATPTAPAPVPDSTLSLIPLPYLAPYSGASPLGANVTINAATGIISGTAPPIPGKYVVNVCVQEFRQGVLLNIHHKDFILKIANCDFASAVLDPTYLNCGGLGLQFENKSTSALIHSYFWDFGVPGAIADTSNDPTPFFNFPDSGTYKIKLIVNKYGTCGDSTTTIAKIYPGFKANFGFDVKCLPDATVFADSSTIKYGQLTAWNWDFGDGAGTSTDKNPSYNFIKGGTRNVKLLVTNSKGCVDSLIKQVTVPVKIVVNVAFKDTSICNLDSMRLLATSNVKSSFSWMPDLSILNANTESPIVSPNITTSYTVYGTDSSGCIDSNAVTVTVFTLPTVTAIPDTVICSGDVIMLGVAGNGSSYQWTPGTGLSATNVLSPNASPVVGTQYIITAKSVEGCIMKDTVNVSVNISPTVRASADSLICAGGAAHLFATPSATTTYSWSPATALNSSIVQAPVASPVVTTSYYVQVTDSNNCKGNDTVVISVIPKPIFAITPPRHEICRGDSLLLTASGGTSYQWFASGVDNGDTTTAINVFPITTTVYTAIITSSACNIQDTETAKVTVSQPFALSVTKSNDVDCIIGRATLQASGGGLQYTWAPDPSLNTTRGASPVATPIETTTYYVTASNGTACVEQDSIQVKIVTANVTNGYYMATAFTPNGDGHNDCFRVKDWGGIKSLRLYVYNRWGQVVFATTSPDGCWDGTLNGRPQPSGTYVFQVWANTVCGDVYRKGTLVLIR